MAATLTDYTLRDNRVQLTLLAAVKRSVQVSVYYSLPAFQGHVLCRAGELTSSIIDQKVYPPILFQHR